MAGKLNLAVSALHRGEDIHATVQATLPEGHAAEVIDIYPGGRIVYPNDPGEAQIFVRISATPGAGGSWNASRDIPYCRPHRDLAVIAEFEGRTFIARAAIHRLRPARRAAAADSASLRRGIGSPPARSVALAPTAKQASVNAPIRSSNCPAPPLGA